MQINANDIEIELTEGCQLKCKHCFAEKIFGPMSEQTLDNTINFILDLRQKTTSDSFCVTFTGGEPGTYNMKLLKEKVIDLKRRIDPTKEFRLIFGTNLAYPLTQDHIEVFKLMDAFALSWDYKDRFSNEKEQALFFKNLQILKGINPNIGINSVLTDYVIKEVTPEMLIHFMLGTGVNNFMFNRLETPITTTEKEFVAKRTVKNSQVRDYVYRFFRLYEKIKQVSDLRIFEFECIIDAFHGEHYNQYSKVCARNLIHIHSNGALTRCNGSYLDNYGNVNTGGIDEEKYQKIIAIHEAERHPGCNTCKYFKYCTGGCPFFCDDDTGCSVPYKIWDYLAVKQGLLGKDDYNNSREETDPSCYVPTKNNESIGQ